MNTTEPSTSDRPWVAFEKEAQEELEDNGIFPEPELDPDELLEPHYPRPLWMDDPAALESTVDDAVDETDSPRLWEFERVQPRPRGAFVVSGPLPHGAGPGRHLRSMKEAEAWARENYPGGFHGMIPEAAPGGRWAAIVSTATSRAAAEAK